MISLEKYKEILGKQLCDELTESQIIELKDNQEKMAELCWEMWVHDKLQKRGGTLNK